MQSQNYWERLIAQPLYSLEQQRERYLAIYVWKMLAGISSAIEEKNGPDIKTVYGATRGQTCVIPRANYQALVGVGS